MKIMKTTSEYAPGIPKKEDYALLPKSRKYPELWEGALQKHDAERAGCFPGGTRILTKEGYVRISDIVNNRRSIEVLSFNKDSKKCEWKKVVNWFKNGSTHEWIKISTSEKNSGFICTPGHKIAIYDGPRSTKYKKAEELTIEDKLLVKDITLSNDQEQFILGALLGGGSLVNRDRKRPTFTYGHSVAQEEFLKFGASLFNLNVGIRKEMGRRNEFYYFRLRHPFLNHLAETLYTPTKEITKDSLKNIDARALAIWFQDDGQWSPSKSQTRDLKRNTKRRRDIGKNKFAGQVYLYTNRFSRESNKILIGKLTEVFRLNFKLRKRDKYYYICLSNINENKNFFEIVSPYMHKSMQYKSPINVGGYKWESYLEGKTVYPVKIHQNSSFSKVNKDTKNGKLYKAKLSKYDIEVEDNHNYFVNNTLVSNSHYDLRLGDSKTGKAYSWALREIPGPGEKVLAVHQPVHCLMPGTIIDGVKIEEFVKEQKPGVASLAETGLVIKARVTAWSESPEKRRNIIKIQFKGKGQTPASLICTEGHKIYTDKGVKLAADISTEDKLLKIVGKNVDDLNCENITTYILEPVLKIEKLVKNTKVYNLNVEPTHNYVANGIVVGNSVPYMDFSGDIKSGYGKGKVKPAFRGKTEILKAEPNKISFVVYNGNKNERYTLVKAFEGKNWLLVNHTPTRETRFEVPSSKPKYKEIDINDLNPSSMDEYWSPKIDGAHSVYVMKRGKPIDVFSYRPSKRNNRLIDHSYKTPLYKQLSPGSAGKLSVLRGEMYATGPSGEALTAGETTRLLNSSTLKSRELQKELGPLKNIVFDVDTYKGKDVSRQPLLQKRKYLHNVTRNVKGLEVTPEYGEPKHKKRLLQDILSGRNPLSSEGIIAYNPSDIYPKKAKIIKDEEVKVVDFFLPTEGSKYSGNAVGGIIGKTEDGVRVRIGTGLTDQMRQDMYNNPNKYLGKEIKVGYTKKFESGQMFQPRALGLRELW